jgi:hypothetical protein
MLFGGRLSLDPRASLVLIDDGWIRFRVAPEVAALILRLRSGLEETLARKIHNPKLDFAAEAGGAGAALIDGVVKLIASEAAGAASPAPPAAPPPPAFQAIAYSAVS